MSSELRELKKLADKAVVGEVCVGYEQITIDETVRRLTVPSDAQYALIRVEADSVPNTALRFRLGTTPTSATVGFPLADKESIDIRGQLNLLRATFIRQNGVSDSVTLNVLYFKPF